MTAYSVSTYDIRGSVAECLAGLKAKIDTIDTGKTLRNMGIVREGNVHHGYLIYDT